ncbi:hypothetical protein ACFOON_16550 [Novosphingobium piscinae]|uniref:Uncharacterized protein n=1 Tax=Novosphingobium piscinae TaxID=1507448 RepID=A0A7X1KQ70_9SPHN|nr:hypothetical protein [Novosphingobium piscinae]MBC2669401.1 hypothetical protein [Novosphingobium piscinae]
MSRFMFARTGGVECMWSNPDPDSPAEILCRLEDCLAALDRIGAGLPAVHLATAIEHLRAQFGLPENSSGSD